MLNLIRNKKFNVYKTLNIVNPLIPIATDEMFLRTISGNDECILHMYTLPNSAIIGAPDTRVPFFDEALFAFYRNNIIPAVRNIGGLGIISDKGILNLSIIMNKPKENFSINEGYELMTNFIKAVFPEGANKIEAIEITNSYCPGDYDLSINGKKFAGIAQRKIKDAVVVSIYISIFGDQQKRANIMREFYDIGIKDQQINYKYPKIDPNCMETLEKLLHKEFTLEDVYERVENVLYSLDCDQVEGEYTEEMIDEYNSIFEQAKERNESYLEGK